MVNWTKRVTDFKDNQVQADEQVVAVGFLQPEGALMKTSVSMGVGGLIGLFIGSRMQKKTDENSRAVQSGLANEFPSGNFIVAVTSKKRVLCYEQNAMSGKPSKFIKEYKTSDFVGADVKKRKLAHLMTLNFRDGGVLAFDIARGQDIDTFSQAITGQVV